MKLSNPRLHLLLILLVIAVLGQITYLRQRPQPPSEMAAVKPVAEPSPSLPSPEPEEPAGEIDLTGMWMSNDRALCTVKQDGTRVTWEAISSYDKGRTFSHTFEGELDGDVLTGSFFDHPPGMNKNSGDLAFQVVGPDRFVLTKSEGSFGGREFTRQAK